MKDLYTIIYYTSNREDEAFEAKIKAKLLAVCGDIPIISVSQKPIDLGKNICVGDVGACDSNLFRQILIGCEAATTPFVISAEADCLYPPDYFQFVPDDTSEYYRFRPLYILNKWGKGQWGGFFPKATAPFAQITKRDYWLRELARAFTGRPLWSPDGDRYHLDLFLAHDWKTCELDSPIVNLKTGQGMRKSTQVDGNCIDKIPYWGKGEDLRKEIWG
jgi:hypothetical protein